MEYIGDLHYDDKLIENDNPIIVFGSGNLLRNLLKQLDELEIRGKVVAICDNAHDRQEKKINNIKIISLRQAHQLYPEAEYIVYNKYYLEICKQLLDNNIFKIHLIRPDSI